MMKRKVFCFLRRDLRLNDNPLLDFVSKNFDQAHFVYLLPYNFEKFRPSRKRFVTQTILSFKRSLIELGHGLDILTENSFNEIFEILSKNKIDHIALSKEFTTYELFFQEKIKEFVSKVHVIDTQTMYKIEDLSFDLKSLSKTFTPFYRGMIKEGHTPFFPLPKVKTLPVSFVKYQDHQYLEDEEDTEKNDFVGGEKFGIQRVESYIFGKKAISTYKQTRNGMLRFDDSSKFSPWISLGSLSARWIYWQIKKYEDQFTLNESTEALVYELFWREYFKLYSLKFGKKIFSLKGPKNKEVNTSGLIDDFKNWCSGSTASDFVNANMKELNSTGWMSNRGRQNVASYLCKELFVDWRLGALYFEENLIDFDPSSNWGNWAYLAGVGADSRDRKFNVQRQAKIYDPDMAYRDKFLP